MEYCDLTNLLLKFYFKYLIRIGRIIEFLEVNGIFIVNLCWLIMFLELVCK